MKDKIIIVTRHAGAVEWLKRKGIVGEVLEHVDSARQVAGFHVFGNIPLHFAGEASRLTLIQMPERSKENRGKELSADEMEACGAYLQTFVVTAFPPVPANMYNFY